MARRSTGTAIVIGLGLGLFLSGRAPEPTSFVGGAAAVSGGRRTQMRAQDLMKGQKVEDIGAVKGLDSIVQVYTQALVEAAAKKGESVPVTKDIMKVRKFYEAMKNDQTEATMKYLDLINGQASVDMNNVERSAEISKMMGLESTVLPVFFRFLAKKQRFNGLGMIADYYMEELYKEQNIVPIRVTSAQTLTDDQKKSIRSKMKKITGAADIKLVSTVNADLLGGFKVEYNFLDADNMRGPENALDYSLKTVLQKAAVGKGVLLAELQEAVDTGR
mmetsp:Transcript_83493/g.269130  ORF Transcript_83493/g.269130 Transcript_83493/m.269130 type:complete len:275 (+) Transcript_83493:104-928(+)